MPTLHSVAAGKWNGHWILLAGRTAGLHGMTGQNAFVPQFENRSVRVIDPVSRQSWSKSLSETNPASGLAADLLDSLSSVNTQFDQTDGRLTIVGGYGYKRSVADHRTYDTITFIDLPGLMAWVKEPACTESTQAAMQIRQIRDAYFQVTGASGRVFEVLLTPTTLAPTPAIGRVGQDITLAWSGSSDWHYLIETSLDLESWQQPQHPIEGTAGPMEWSHPVDQPKRFFRVLGGTRSLDP